MGKYSNEEILKGITERRSKVLLFIYSEYLPMIRNFITRQNGNEIEAEDLFQDTIIIIYEKIKSRNLKLSSSFKTYFYAISKYLWFQRRQGLNRLVFHDQQEELWDVIMGYEEYKEFEEEKLFQEHFINLDKDCQKVLQSYFDKKPYKEIADDLNFKSSYIKKLKFNCKEKLFQSIVNDPRYKELIDTKNSTTVDNRRKNNSTSRKVQNPKKKNKNSNDDKTGKNK